MMYLSDFIFPDVERETSFFMAEKLGIDSPFGNCSAVDGKVFRILPASVLVYDFRDVVLADSALACHKDSQFCQSDSHRHLDGTVQRRIIADYIVFVLYFL